MTGKNVCIRGDLSKITKKNEEWQLTHRSNGHEECDKNVSDEDIRIMAIHARFFFVTYGSFSLLNHQLYFPLSACDFCPSAVSGILDQQRSRVSSRLLLRYMTSLFTRRGFIQHSHYSSIWCPLKSSNQEWWWTQKQVNKKEGATRIWYHILRVPGMHT